MANSTSPRMILGFLVAPIFPGLLAIILAAPFRVATAGLGLRELAEAAWIIGLSAVCGYPVAVVLGVPLYVFFKSRGWNGSLVYVAAGAFLGLVVYLVYVLLAAYSSNGLWGATENFSNTAQIYIPLGMICGAVATLLFWLIVRPDRSRRF